MARAGDRSTREHDTAKVPLALWQTVDCTTRIAAAVMVYAKHKAKPVEPAVLAEGWYYDETVSRFMGGPGREGFGAIAWFDANVVDGAVNGVGRLVRGTAQRIRTVQSGNVRNYAAAIGVAVVLLLAWFVVGPGQPVISFPILTMLVAGAGRSGRSWSCCILQASTRMGEADRLLTSVLTGGLSIWVVVAFDKSNGDFQFVSMHTWISRGASRGTSASTASRCSSCCSQACCSRS